MEVTCKREDGEVVFVLAGKFTYVETIKFKTAVLDVAREIEEAKITLDLYSIESIDSVGMGQFLFLDDLSKEKGKKITIRGLSPEIKRLFVETQFDEIFDLK